MISFSLGNLSYHIFFQKDQTGDGVVQILPVEESNRLNGSLNNEKESQFVNEESEAPNEKKDKKDKEDKKDKQR